MKAKIIFNLSDPEDAADFEITAKAKGMSAFIYWLLEMLRTTVKYEEPDTPKYAAHQDLRECVADKLDELDLPEYLFY